MIWRWEKKKIPLGLTEIVKENNNRNLRQRKFIRDIRWNNDSIAYRLATRAMKEIKEIEIARSKKGLVKKYRNMIILTYTNNCRIRNCLYCNNNTN